MPNPAIEADNQLTVAIAKLLGHTGAKGFEIRYCEPDGNDNLQIIVWLAIADYGGGRFETAAALTPGQAAWRLGEKLIDGGTCRLCGNPTSLTEGEDDLMNNPFVRVTHNRTLCQYRYRNGVIIRGCDSREVGTRA